MFLQASAVMVNPGFNLPVTHRIIDSPYNRHSFLHLLRKIFSYT